MSDAAEVTTNMQCQLCGGVDFEPLVSVPNALFSTNITAFFIVRCTRCQLATMQPFPTAADVYEIYVEEGSFSRTVPNPYRDSMFFNLLEPLYQKYGNDLYFIASQCWQLTSGNRRVLDVGCGVGRLLSWFMRMPGCDPHNIYGIDIDPQARSNAPQHVRGRIVIDDLLLHEFAEPFDIITMRFVIEHLLDLESYLRRVVELLKPGGILFVSTPDIDSAQARQLREDWALINDPAQKIGHVRWFNPHAVRCLAASLGLEIEKCINRGQFLYELPVPAQMLLRRVLGSEPGTNRFIRHYTVRIIYATLIDGLLSQALSRGDGIYAFMRKSGE